MATKSSKKPAEKHKTVAKKTSSKPAPAKNKSIRQCMDESEVLRFHMRIITVLSIAICVLTSALVLSIVFSLMD